MIKIVLLVFLLTEFVFVSVQVFSIVNIIFGQGRLFTFDKFLVAPPSSSGTLLLNAQTDLYRQCSSHDSCPDSSLCCPTLDGVCHTCCPDNCKEINYVPCERECGIVYSNENQLRSCLGTYLNRSVPLFSDQNSNCTMDTDCDSNACGFVNNCLGVSQTVCCSTSKNIFNRCVNQSVGGSCDMFYDAYNPYVCGTKSFCSQTNDACGICEDVVPLQGFRPTGCLYMHERTYEFQTENVIEVRLDVMNDCIVECDILMDPVLINACKLGCQAFNYNLNTQSDTQCSVFQQRSGVLLNPSRVIVSNVDYNVETCCSVCSKLLRSCVGFARNPNNNMCQFFDDTMNINFPVQIFDNAQYDVIFTHDSFGGSMSPPPPFNVCDGYTKFVDKSIQCDQQFSSYVVNAANVDECCSKCTSIHECNAFEFDIQNNECTVFSCKALKVTNLIDDTQKISFMIVDVANPTLDRTFIDDILEPQVLIPLIVGALLAFSLVVLMFSLCTKERSESIMLLLKYIVNLFRRKKSSTEIIVLDKDTRKKISETLNKSSSMDADPKEGTKQKDDNMRKQETFP
jgi:hypothetical protein